MYPWGLAFHAAGIAAASATFHFHTRWPYQEVGRGGINLTPRYLVYNRPCFADSWDGLLCEQKKFTLPGEQLLSPQSAQILYTADLPVASLARAETVLSVRTASWQAGAEYCLPTTTLWVLPYRKSGLTAKNPALKCRMTMAWLPT